jgi:hypothetical protein
MMARAPHRHIGQSGAEARREAYEKKWKITHKAKWEQKQVPRQVGELSDYRFIRHLEVATEILGIRLPARKLRAALNDLYLAKIDVLYLYGDGEHRFDTVVEACEYLVAEQGLGSPSATFEREVERLHRAWARSGRSVKASERSAPIIWKRP